MFMRTNLLRISVVALSTWLLSPTGLAGSFRTITVDGDSSDWVGVVPAYVNENGVNNPTGVDFQEVYLANDADFLYIRFTLQQPADPISAWNTYIWLDNDNSSATGFHPFGNPNFGSSLMIINDQAYQQAGGGWNEGTLPAAGAAYGASAIPGTDFEFKIARNVTGVAGDFAGLPLLNGDPIGVQLASETGTADSLPGWSNYGDVYYTMATVPEPTTFALLGVGALLFSGKLAYGRRNFGGADGSQSAGRNHEIE